MNITAIAIIALICWTIVKLTDRSKKVKPEASPKQVDIQNQQMLHQLQSMQERIAVLEAIVTDEKYNLKREFDNLSRDRAA